MIVEEALRSYLFAYLFWIAFPVGALALLMILSLTGGEWGRGGQSVLRAMARTIPDMAILFVPIVIGLGKIYPWYHANGERALPEHKAIYLNPTFFFARALIYWAVWIGLSILLDRRLNLAKVSAAGLIVLGFTGSFASYDWQMSVEPFWYSTIYGMVFLVGQALQCWALVVAVVCTFIRRGWMERPKDPVLRDIGNILLTLVILWAYVSFMQYLVIWSGNLPEEASWFVARTRGAWGGLAVCLVILQFAIPFSALLLRSSKERIARLQWIALTILVSRVLEQAWMVLPGLSKGRGVSVLLHGVAWLVVGGLWLWRFSGRWRARAPSEAIDVR